MYVDASGDPGIKNTTGLEKFYIVSGVIIPQRQHERYCELVANMKEALLPNVSSPWELHAVEIWNRVGEFRDMDEKKRHEIFQKVVDLISVLNISIITITVNKDIMKKKWKSGILKTSWTLLVEQFEQYLDRESSISITGYIRADKMGRDEMKNVSFVVEKFAKRGTYYQRSKHVDGNVEFLDSHKSNFIQLADVVAYVTHKHCKGDTHFQDWHDALTLQTYESHGGLPNHDI